MSDETKTTTNSITKDAQPTKETHPILPAQDRRIPQTYTGDEGRISVEEKLRQKNEDEINKTKGKEEVTGQDISQMNVEEGEGVRTEEGSSNTNTVLNYINSIVGSGMIGIPFALKEAGLWMGLILLISVSIMIDYSLRLVVRTGNLSDNDSYQGVMESAFGRPGFYILSFLQFIFPFIAMVSYNVISGDTVTKLIGAAAEIANSGTSDVDADDSVLSKRPLIILIATCFVTLPLSLYRDISQLAKVSLISIVFVVFIIITIVIRLPTLGSHIPFSEDAWDVSHAGLPKAVGIFAFAFVCHHNTFLLFSAMKEKTERSWARVTHISCLFSLLTMMTIGVTGYLTFTDVTQGDLMENYCLDDTLMNVSRLFFAFIVLLTLPIECFVCRDVVYNVFWKDSKNASTTKHFLVTASIVVASAAVSISTECLGTVLELNGIIAAVPLAFVFPPLCYLKLRSEPWMSWSSIPAMSMTVFGVLIAVTGLGLMIQQGLPGCSHGTNPCLYSDNNTIIYNVTLLNL